MPPALSPCQSFPIFICYSWSVTPPALGALTPILFVSVSVFSLSNLISYSAQTASPLVPCWPLLSGGYNVGPLTPDQVSLVGVFWKVSLLQGTSIPSSINTTPYLPPWADIFQSG